jgi:O-antigen/teichoic acid export membrane protein
MKRIEALLEKFHVDAADISGLKNMGMKPIAMLLSFIYIPILLSYLGDEKYGLWTTILSVISWVNYFDVGIGHGLRNILTKELTEKRYKDAQKSVSTAYIALTGIAFVILVILIILTFTSNWYSVFNTTIDMKIPLLISFIFIVINFVLALCNTLLYALQMSERVALRNILVQVANVVGIMLLKWYSSPSLIWMAILFGATNMIVYLATTITLFRRNDFLKPKGILFEKGKISAISNVGIKFFAIQISCMFLYTVDNMLITHYFGAAEVTPFHVTDKAFNMIFSFLNALTIPYWSKTTEALVKGDTAWVNRAIKKMYGVYAFFAVAYIILMFAFKPLARLWLGRELNYQPWIIAVMCLYYLLFSFVTVNTPFINGTGQINGQLIVSCAMGIMNVPLSIFLGVNCGLGVVGIRLATTILMAFVAVFYPINLRSILRRVKSLTADYS